jgi:hypothetical protein
MPAEWTSWIALALLALVAACLGVLVLLLRRVEGLARGQGADDSGAQTAAALKRLADAHAELDLRRLEHVLIDIRDGQRRVEDRLLATLEVRAQPPSGASAIEPVGQTLASTLPERIVTRLLALGYERIQFVTPLADVQKLAASDGEVAVEARRDGASCKGRVLVRGGAIADLQLQSAYSIFP